MLFVSFLFGTGRVTQWYSGSGYSYSPYVRGGMQYSNGIATVPRDSLYYVYVQMRFYSKSGSGNYKNARFCIAINGTCQFYSYTHTQDYGDWYNPYSGRSLLLKNKDQLSVQFTGSTILLFF
ncbi:uncharacterized protein LOC134195966 [Corticium candelabrum]|uniref:uncharacterized protein LOC134195966 n=1 Tax=Corticium candelabrum TaxID=121492 RepID=UPI002E26699D|nr:uncharacterized protein LOC134195966 [Corticium candelabrum]